MTSPVPDALRTQLAEVLHDALCSECNPAAGTGLLIRSADADKAADALAPFLARARAEGAAEALREAAEWLNREPEDGGAPYTVDDDPFDTTGDFFEGAVWAVHSLRTRAAALSAPTTTEGDPT